MRVVRAARLARRPLVVSAHGYDVTSTLLDGQDLQPLIDYTSRFLAVSHFIAENLERRGVPATKIRVAYTGTTVGPPPVKWPDDRQGILFVGRLVEKKGAADLLQAIAILPEDLRSTGLTVVGDGPLRQSLEYLARNLGVRAEFVGAEDSARIRARMEAAAVFCVPSKRAANGDAEGFGMVFLEAAERELPVVTYSSGGTPEAVADTESGILCPEGDVPALAKALEALLARPERAREMGVAGRRRVERAFDIRDRIKILEEEYARAARMGTDPS
jgi:glycosyltransferase involved in cell wall biosynthesis